MANKPTEIMITGTVGDAAGPVAGYFVFASTTLVRHASSNDVLIPDEIIVTVGIDGELSFPLSATNDPAWSPTGWEWECRPHFPGWTDAFTFAVPYDSAGGTLDFSKIAPTPGDGTAQLYALVNHTHAGGGGGSLTPAATVTSMAAYGQASVVGVDLDYAREDHRHATPAAPTAASVGADPTGTATSAVGSHVAAADPHPQYSVVYYWNGSSYDVVNGAAVYVGGTGPVSPVNGDVVFPT